ncbi:MAG TPA: MBL fold metallo-hydrolase, partial [Thermoanaerobaculia bacterium]|nr:MBL fold metallo-hydrolase [Thermoanaerobaculia bacterium]
MPPSKPYTVLYDGQCEICQASVAWLHTLDRRGRVDCRPIVPAELPRLEPKLRLEECLRELHVLDPEGRILVGWDAVAALARLFPPTWIAGALGRIPPFRWLGRAAYRFVAANRYSLSKCRGGACKVARPDAVRRKSSFPAFWSCYTLGMALKLPLALASAAKASWKRVLDYTRTFRRRVEILDGKLTLCFLGSPRCDAIPIFFGERFAAVLYRGLLVDPGSPPMRRSLAKHLARLPRGTVRAVVATHHHEEHVGSLNWAAQRTSAAVKAGAETIRKLRPPARLPFVRRCLIGQPPSLDPPYEEIGERLPVEGGELQVFPAPGHCDDHIVLWDPETKVLLCGDAFMGAMFATPNPDVDSRRWIESLERLLGLGVEILVEGHGHVHTLRSDVPDVPGVVLRRDPRRQIDEKLQYLRWLRGQIEAGREEGLPVAAIEASCFPWARRSTWENLVSDEMTRLLSLGHFSRSELVRSFVRDPETRET